MHDGLAALDLEEPRSRTRSLLVAGGVALAFAAMATGFATVLRPVIESDPTVRFAGPPPKLARADPAPEINVVSEPAVAAPAQETTVAAAQPAVQAIPGPPPPFAPDFKGPRVAILISEVGTSPATARAAIGDLPREVGLAFSPYPNDSRALSTAARAAGHEVWVSVPMQPKSWPRVSPGANTLVVRDAPEENVRRLDWALARVDRPVGVTTMMGSAFTESRAALDPVMGALAPKGLAFIDARSSGRSVAPEVARAAKVRAGSNDRFLDEGGGIAANLAALEAMAKRDGSAIGFARALPASIAAIDAWAAGLEAKGILLVPPGSLARAE